MKFFISFIFILIIFSSSCSRLSKSSAENIRALTQEPNLPKERNFLREMALGDTVLLVYKQSGWSNTAHLRNMSHYSFYAIHKIWRTGDITYVRKKTRAYTARDRFKEFEFDTMKYRLDEVMNLLSGFADYCQDEFYRPSKEEIEKCIWIYDFKDRSAFALEEFLSEDLSSTRYNRWRFEIPSYEELKKWREKDYNGGKWKTEMLVFWNDTCKISYSDQLSFLPGRIFDY